jgi:hypothetical protein
MSGGGGGGGAEPAKQYQYKYYITFAVLLAENQLADIVKIFENGKLIYEEGDSGNPRWDSLTFYDGTQTSADSLLQAIHGAENTPAYLGYSYVVFERYALENAGNTIPNLEFIVREKISTTVSQAITQIMERADYTTNQFSIDSSLAATQMLGYVSSGPASTKSLLIDLMLAFDILSYEYNGIIYFKPRSNIAQYSIDEKFLSAQTNDSGQSTENSQLVIVNLDQRKFPKEVNMQYPDTTKDLQWGSQSEVKQNNPSFITKVLKEETKVTMTPSQARARVNTLLWQKWSENKSVSFNLGPNKFLIQESDVISIDIDGQTYIIRIESTTTGANYITEVSGVVVGLTGSSNNSPYFGPVIPSEDAVYDPQELYEIPDLSPYIIDCGPLRIGDEQQYLVYTGQSIETGNEFLGATIYKALSASSTYTPLRATTLQSTSGNITTTLGEFIGYGWDRTNSFQVHLNFGNLISRDETEVLQGANWAIVGDEVIGFSTATLVGTDTYQLSNLIRARRGTVSVDHSIDERFVLLYIPEIETMARSSADYNVTRYFKWVPSAEDESNVTPITDFYQARTLREFAPVYFTGVKNANDWNFAWKRVTRTLWSPLGNTTQPAPDGRHYGLRIYNGADIIRIINVRDTEIATYTEAQQIADFGVAQSSVTAGIFQYNDNKGLEGIENKETF